MHLLVLSLLAEQPKKKSFSSSFWSSGTTKITPCWHSLKFAGRRHWTTGPPLDKIKYWPFEPRAFLGVGQEIIGTLGWWFSELLLTLSCNSSVSRVCLPPHVIVELLAILYTYILIPEIPILYFKVHSLSVDIICIPYITNTWFTALRCTFLGKWDPQTYGNSWAQSWDVEHITDSNNMSPTSATGLKPWGD